MFTATDILIEARQGNFPSPAELARITFNSKQAGALAAAVAHHRVSEPAVRAAIKRVAFEIDPACAAALEEPGRSSSVWAHLSSDIKAARSLSTVDLSRAWQALGDTPEDDFWCGHFLMTCFVVGVRGENAAILTASMRDSGEVLDLRPRYRARGYALVRRYPTGGLSEKIALLMPALFAMFGDRLRLKSPFFVARTLAYTGGSWDKFGSIPGFSFSTDEQQLIERLDAVSIAMVVTADGINPADEFLYMARSATATVECDGLIISSIASKHLAMPADLLLMDMRYGPGAFLADQDKAHEIGGAIRALTEEGGINTLIAARENREPDGAAVGNYLEVLEAIEILSGRISGVFDPRGMERQFALCADYFIKMVAAIQGRPGSGIAWLWELIYEARRSGELLLSYERFLAAHGVEDGSRQELLRGAVGWLETRERTVVHADRCGQCMSIDLKKLGYVVNQGLCRDTELPDKVDLHAGIILKIRLYDAVRIGDPLCELIGSPGRMAAVFDDINSCFSIH